MDVDIQTTVGTISLGLGLKKWDYDSYGMLRMREAGQSSDLTSRDLS